MEHKSPLATRVLDLKLGIHWNSLQDIKGFCPQNMSSFFFFFSSEETEQFLYYPFKISLRNVKTASFSSEKKKNVSFCQIFSFSVGCLIHDNLLNIPLIKCINSLQEKLVKWLPESIVVFPLSKNCHKYPSSLIEGKQVWKFIACNRYD